MKFQFFSRSTLYCLLAILLLQHADIIAQSAAEQDPCAPIVVCGTASTQTAYSGNPYSGSTSHLPLGCLTSFYNVVFTKVTIASSGVFQFTITPSTSCDDYDWIVYKINPSYPCTEGLDSAVIVRCDANSLASSPGGLTGLSDTTTVCCSQGGGNGPAFLSAINASAGDVFLIGVCNAGTYGCSSSTPASPFTMSFTGSTTTIQNVTPTLSSSTTPPGVCNNTVFSYSPASTAVNTVFTWSRATVSGISNAAASGSGNPNETLSDTTSSAVSVVYVDTLRANGCTNTQNVTVSVIPTITPSVSITASPGNNITLGTSVTFTATPVNGGSSPTYQWKKNGSNTGSNSNTLTTNTLHNGDVISCVLTSGATCPFPASVNSNYIVSNIIPAVSVSGSTLCAGSTLTVSSSVSPLQIVWKQNGNPVYTTYASWNGNATTVAGGNGQGSLSSQLYNPSAVYVDALGNIYIADAYNARVQKWLPGATSGTTVASQLTPWGVFVDKYWNVYATDQANSRAQKWPPGASSGTTVAGGNGPGSAANEFLNPWGVYIDSVGNVYVADVSNHRIQKWPPGAASGTTIAGGNGAGSGANQLNNPSGIFFDASGNLYIADYSNNRIQKWAPGATSGTTVAGGNGAGAATNQLNNPSGVYVDGLGNIYIADANNNRIVRWLPGATSGTIIAGGFGIGNASNQLSGPRGVFLDNNGNIYVADQNNNRIQKFAINDTMTYTAVGAGYYTATVTTPEGLTVTSNIDTIYSAVSPSVAITANPGNNIIQGTSITFTAVPTNAGTNPSYQWKVNGNIIGVATNTYTNSNLNNNDLVTCTVTSNAPCASPATASNSNVIGIIPTLSLSGTTSCPGSVLTLSSNITPIQIQWKQNGNIISTTNTYWSSGGTTVAGQSSGAAGTDASHLTSPAGICTDFAGNIYVLDNNSNPRVMKWAPGASSGTVVAGGNGVGAGANQFNGPTSIAMDINGNLYVSDANNSRVQKWAPGATSGITVATGFNNPFGIFVDTAGNLFVCDAYNYRVQKFLPGSTTGITVAGGNGNGNGANQFAFPLDVYVDRNGNIYVLDFSNQRVQKWAAGATSGTTVAGGAGNGCFIGELNSPGGFCVDAAGNVYVTSQCSGGVVTLWPPGATSWTTAVGGNGQGTASNQFNGPSRVCFDANGDLYVDDRQNNRVQKFSKAIIMTYTTSGGGYYTATVTSPRGLVATSNVDTIYSASNPSVFIYASPGNYVSSNTSVTFTATPTNGGAGPSYQWKLNGNNVGTNSSTYTNSSWNNEDSVSCILTSNAPCPTSLVATSNTIHINVPIVSLSGSTSCPGSILTLSSSLPPWQIVWQQNGNTVYTSYAGWNANATTVAGGNGYGSSSNQLAYPTGIFVDSVGNIYIADQSARVVKWAPGATSGTTVAGGNGAGSASNQLHDALNVFVDNSGNVYVADFVNSRVQKWAPGATSGITVAGGNGNGSAANQLWEPIGLFVDGSGNVYVADGGNERIQKWAPGATSGVTVAGGNGTGSAANQFNYPHGIVIDNAGNLFIADANNNRVQKWASGASSGTTVAGGNGSGAAANQLAEANFVCIDTSGNIYVTDGNNNRVMKWTPGATSGTLVVGGNGPGSASNQFYGPFGIAFDHNNNIYVADLSNSRVQKFAIGNTMTYTATSAGLYTATVTTFQGATATTSVDTINTITNPSVTISAYPGSYIFPGTLVTFTAFPTNGGSNPAYQWKLNGNNVGANSNTYTSSSLNNSDIVSCVLSSNALCASPTNANSNYSIVAFIPTSSIAASSACSPSVLTVSSSVSPLQIQWQQNGNIVHTTYASWNANATTVAGGNGLGNSNSQLFYPGDVCLDTLGNLYVTDVYNNRVMKWAPGATSGTVVAGGNGQGSNPNQLYNPAGIVIDKYGNMYIGDQLNSRVQKWAPGASSGTTVAGGNGAGANANQFNQVMGVRLDTAGNLYVCDFGNHRIQKWAPGATSGTTVAGGNGQGSDSAHLSYPWELYLDSSNNIYITDFGNHRVQKWAQGASYGTTVAGGNGAGSAANQLNSPSGIYLDALGNMYIVNIGSNSIKRWVPGAATGTVIVGGNGTGSGSNQFHQPWGMLIDKNGSLYAGDQYNNRVQKFTINDTLTYTATSPGNYTATITSFPGGTATSVVDTVFSPPAITSQFAYDTICPNADALFSISATGSGLSYQWYQNNLPLSDTANVGGSHTHSLVLAYEPAYGNGNVYKCVVTGTCSPPVSSNNFTLVVSAYTAIGSQPNNDTICAGNNASFSTTASGTNLSYQWKLNGTNISNVGVYSGATTNTLSITNAPASMNGSQYKCLISGSCGTITTNTTTLNVNSLPAIATQPVSSVICAGSNTSFSLSATGTGLAYQWQADTGMGFYNISNSANYSGVTSNVLSLSAATASMNLFKYRCFVSGTCSPPQYSNTDTLTVYTSPFISSQSTSSTVCEGNNTVFSVSATGGALTYQWKVNTGSSFVNISNGGVYSGATSSSLTITGLTASMNGYQYQCYVSGACSPAVSSNTLTLTVNTAPNIISIPSGSSICEGSNTSFSLSATGTGLTYQWYLSTGSGFNTLSNNSIYNGATTNVLSVSGVTASMNGYQYKCTVSGVCAPAATTNAVILFVNTLPAIPVQAQNAVACVGRDTSFHVGATGTGISFQWQLNAGSGFSNLSNGGPYSGATDSILRIYGVADTMNGYHYRCIVPGFCIPPDTSQNVLLTVIDPPAITAQPNNDTVCAGSNASFSVSATGSGLSYQWQVNTAGGYINLNNSSAYSGVTSNTLSISGTVISLNGNQYRCVITGNCTPIVNSNSATLVIHALPSVNTPAVSSSICVGTSTSFSISASGAGITYQWQLNNGSGFVNIANGGNYSGATSNTLSLSSVAVAMSGNTYRCIVSGICIPAAVSDTVSLTVYTPPAISAQPSSTATCTTANASFSISATGSGLLYQWQVNTGGGFANVTNDTVYGGATSSTLTITNAAVSLSANTYRCIVSGICSPPDTSGIAILTVNLPISIASQSVNNTTICSGNNVTFSFIATGTILSYQWQVNLGFGYLNLSNGSFYSGTSTNTLVITSANSTLNGYKYRCLISGPCTTNLSSDTATLTVNPLPPAYITTSTSLSFCPYDSVVLQASTGTGLSYQWYLNNSIILSAVNASYTAHIGGSYVVAVTNTQSCTVNSSAVLVSLYPLPPANMTPSGIDTICSNDTLFLHVNSGTNLSYQWKNNGVGIVGATDTIYSTIFPGNYSVIVTNNFGCVTASSSLSLASVPAIIPSIYEVMGNTTFCYGDSVVLGAVSNYNSYQWQLNGVNIPGAINADYTVHTGGNYQVVATSQYCTTVSPITSVVVNPLPFDSLIYNIPPVICSGSGFYVIAAFPVTGQTYQWYKNGLIIYGATYTKDTVTVPDGYNVKISNALGCVVFTPSIFVTSATSPVPQINAQGLLLTTTQSYSSYQWYKDSIVLNGAINASYSVSQNGSYSVLVTDSNGCSGMSAPYLVNSLGINSMFVKATDIHIYPNPATSVVHIEAPVKVNVSIADIAGREIFQQDRAEVIDLSKLANGVYMIKVFNEKNVLLKTERMIKNGY